MGERLARIAQWENAGPVSKRRAILHAQRSSDSDGTLADPLHTVRPHSGLGGQLPAPETVQFAS